MAKHRNRITQAPDTYRVLGIDTGFQQKDVKSHILKLIGISIIMKIAMLCVTTMVFHLPIDTFDLQYYLSHMNAWVGGATPYIGQTFDYPPLALLPMAIAYIPTVLFSNASWFVITFMGLMVICDVITTICIYLIGLKIWNDPSKAALSGYIYATAFSGAYFVLTKFDAFPTCLLMLALAYTLYNQRTRGYASAFAGACTKIYPGITIPFIALYNSKSTSLKEAFMPIIKVCGVLAAALVVITIAFPDKVITYITGSLIRPDSIYVNTATYTMYTYLTSVFHIAIEYDMVTKAFMGFAALFLIYLMYLAYKMEDITPKRLIKFCLLGIFTVVFCMSYRSPQYALWFTPLICLLIADRIEPIILFYTIQFVAYIEFPGTFGGLWVNNVYLQPLGTYIGNCALLLFTVEFLLYLVLVYSAVQPKRSFNIIGD